MVTARVASGSPKVFSPCLQHLHCVLLAALALHLATALALCLAAALALHLTAPSSKTELQSTQCSSGWVCRPLIRTSRTPKGELRIERTAAGKRAPAAVATQVQFSFVTSTKTQIMISTAAPRSVFDCVVCCSSVTCLGGLLRKRSEVP